MKTYLKICLLLTVLLLLATCTKEPALPDLALIPWIESHGYQRSELFPVVTSRNVSGPQVKVSVNHESQYLLMDFNAIDLALRENTYKNVNFEPQRMTNRITETSEMLFEEGYIHDVSLLGRDYPILYVSIIKHSSAPFKAKGIIGRNFLIDGQLTLDIQNKILAFTTEPEYSLNNLYPDSLLTPINLNGNHDDNHGLLKFFCYINGAKHPATLSTRNSITMISPELADTLSQKHNAQNVTVGSLKIGDKIFTNINCLVSEELLTLEPENPETINLVIGMDLIGQCLLTIDFINGKMVIE
ncbi:MAG: hypothetical protein KAU06_07555 [Candidatus Marinimicrobia bacterium]|nr:hypothetical protein [Candidatus Neomarinimicrobiota bacterium]